MLIRLTAPSHEELASGVPMAGWRVGAVFPGGSTGRPASVGWKGQKFPAPLMPRTNRRRTSYRVTCGCASRIARSSVSRSAGRLIRSASSWIASVAPAAAPRARGHDPRGRPQWPDALQHGDAAGQTEQRACQ
jgi:hypothetical protein